MGVMALHRLSETEAEREAAWLEYCRNKFEREK
jgi:hypothetical protein